MAEGNETRTIILHETRRPPRLGLWLAVLAVLPFPVAALVLMLAPEAALREPVRLWGAALLLFFSGVRRGLGFRTEGGPTAMQLAVFAALFTGGLAALLLSLHAALWLLTFAFAALTVLDPIAAERGEAPLWMSGLRIVQMPLAAAGLFAVALI